MSATLCLLLYPVFPVRFLLSQFGRYHLPYLWTTCMWVRAVLLSLCAHLLGLTHSVISSIKGSINILKWFDYVLITIISFHLLEGLLPWYATALLNTAVAMLEFFHHIW